jgi:hypothetical protein
MNAQFDRIKYASAAKLGDALRITSKVDNLGNGRYIVHICILLHKNMCAWPSTLGTVALTITSKILQKARVTVQKARVTVQKARVTVQKARVILQKARVAHGDR